MEIESFGGLLKKTMYFIRERARRRDNDNCMEEKH